MERVHGWMLVCSVMVFGCDRRPPEPSPIVVSAPRVASSAGHVSGDKAAADGRKEPERCMVPMAPEATKVPPPAGAQCPADPVFGGVKLPRGEVTFLAGSDGSTVEVELATSPHQRERGLMYRRSMPENVGMLFAFEEPRVQTFWMHNTCIPLDMLFIARDGFIAGIVENAPTLNDDGRSVACPVAYVLELNAGFARRHGVKPGQYVKLPGE
ncbi:MAG TPA: DUF192 domain-containing protein [Polyangiaceae bacterium]|nr:DUF192 domain-containing protein [Polyangiaceae bacterium]